MKLKYLTAIALTAMALYSCDEETGKLGASITNTSDQLIVSAETFDVLTNSYLPDSVYSYSEECYLGMIIDPETDTYVRSGFMAQFNMMEKTHLPDKANIVSLEDGEIIADSAAIILYFDHVETFGDSLAAMKMKVSELDKPVEDGVHYSNFDPEAAGYIRKDGLKHYQSYSMANMNWSDSLRNAMSGYYYLRVSLKEPYKAKDGTVYNNYGTYVLRNYYQHPEHFKNSYAFIHNVCPGFYFENYDGVGLMSYFNQVDLRIYYRYKDKEEDPDDPDAVYVSYLGASSTQEVLQTVTVQNEKEALKRLTDESDCTFLKSPCGIFTEVTLPVDDIKDQHANDSLLSATVSFNRLNNEQKVTNYSFDTTPHVLLIEKDSINAFFENGRNYNNRYAFYTSLSKNAYSFSGSSDISNLIVKMYNDKKEGLKNDPDWVAHHPNWNKAMLIPVYPITATTTTATSASSSTTSTAPVLIANEMGLTSTRLVRGTKENPIKIRVVFAKFNE